MLQRHQRNNIDQLVAFAREQLQRDLLTFKDKTTRTMHLASTASNLLVIYENMSYPLIGLQVIKQNLTNTKHPHSLQIQMILDKAQLFYLESVKHDLTRLKQDQKIQHLSQEDIKEYIQEVNWKLGFQRQSILNQSQQEIGDNIDLMKFFEGVRSFQNWEQDLEKRTIQKLKKFSNQIQNGLTLKKGFLISKVQKIYQNIQIKRYAQFIDALKNQANLKKKLSVFQKIQKNQIKDSFNLIKILTKSRNTLAKIKQIFTKASQKINYNSLLNGFRKILQLKKNSIIMVKTISKIYDKNKLLYSHTFLKRISVKAFQMYQNFGQAVEKINRIIKKISTKNIVKALRIPYFPICKKLDKLYIKINMQMFQQINIYGKHRKSIKQAVSQKLRGKILLSILKYETKPINMRKTFLNWYLKSHEQKYSKMIYNIWLNGNTSKFTFLMRIKNLINNVKRQKISQQLKIFLMVMMQKMNNYYNNCQKGYITKWLNRHRYCRKLNNLLEKLCQKGRKIDYDLTKQCYLKIILLAKKKKNLQIYFKKRINIAQTNYKIGFDLWKRIPNIKKARGKLQLLSFLRMKLDQIQMDERIMLDIFKKYKILGRQKKIRFLTKVFTKDLIYLSSFLNIWKANAQKIKTDGQRSTEKTTIYKTNASKNIFVQLSNLQNTTKKQVIRKMVKRANFLDRRKNLLKKTFENLVNNSCKNNLTKSYEQFKINYKQGIKKKQKLVYNLVTANKIKQAESISIWYTGMRIQKANQKKNQLEKAFAAINSYIKSNFDSVVNNRYVFLYLQKVSVNYRKNIINSLEKIRRLPPRINWNIKKNAIKFIENLQFLINRDKTSIYQKFKTNYYQGQFKKKKIMNFMNHQYFDQIRKYFKLYATNVRQIKINKRHNSVIKCFQNLISIQNNNFYPLMSGEKLWIKKAENFNKFNFRILQRLRQGFRLWHTNTKKLSYIISITAEKKKRLLSIVSEMVEKNSFSQTKKCVGYFQKNSKIIQVQIHFLKKLCDSQAGKVIKAMMIWKNLPKPKNKQLVAKASKFERNLFNIAQKMIRSTLVRFKDEHYFGNDRKKEAIRTLVARSCTGIQKYFDIWKKNNKLITLFSQCHKVQSIFELLMNKQRKNISYLIEGNRSKKIQNAFSDILRWWHKHSIRVFNNWRNKVKLIKKEQAIKIKNLQKLAALQKIIQKKKLLNILAKIKKQIFLRKVYSTIFIKHQKLKFHSIFNNIKNLPDNKQLIKKQNKRKSTLKLFNKLQQQVRNDKIQSLQYFKDIRYKGNLKKIKSCQSYLKDKISQVHKILVLWQNISRADKKKRRENSIENAFQLMFLIQKSNFNQILQSLKLSQIKKRSIQKLCNALQIKKKGFFVIWRSKIKQLKMNQMLNNSKKKAILQKINKLLSGTSQQNVKKTIKNFYLNSKIAQVQVKFIQRLLQTKSGKVLQAFNQWKKIPAQNLKQKYKKGQKFFFKLDILIKNKLSETHDNFKKNYEQGSTLKKQSVLQLLDITSSGIRKFYNRWIRITKRDHTLKQAYSMMHSLDAMNTCIVQQFKILFEDQRSMKIKTKAIQKLIIATNQNIGVYFNKWLQNIRQKKLAQQLIQKQKTTALKIFTKVLGSSQQIQIRQTIEKFHKNSSISKISRNFLNRLLKTKSGKVVQLFQIWKSIPDAKLAKKKKKAIRFESNLNKMCIKYIKSGFQPFKVSSLQARNKKKWCIEKLIRASMGEQKKKFILWRQIIKQQKMLAHTHLFDSVFQKLNEKFGNSVIFLLKNSSQQVTKKKNLCRKLINNSSFVQHHAYFIWKQALQSDNLKIQKTQSKVKTNLINFINVNEKVQHRKLVQIIFYFKKLLNFKNKLTADITKQTKNKKGIQFYQKLITYAHKNTGIFLTQLLKNHKQASFFNKSKNIQKSFQNMNNVFAQSLLILVRSNKQTLILQKALNRIFDNLKISTQKAFNLWRQHKNILNLQTRIGQQKKKGVIEILTRCLQNQQRIVIPYVISRFQKNYRSLKLRKQILAKIILCKAGKVPLAFMIWKGLPNPDAKKVKQKAMKFQMGLVRMINRNLKNTIQKFKQETYEGNSKKKNAVRKLILVTMSDSNRCFNKWRKVNSQAKITQKILAITKTFENTTFKFRQNFAIFNDFNQPNRKKQAIIYKLSKNIYGNLSWVLREWRNTIKDQKCYQVNKVLQRFNPNYFNFKIMKFTFDKIKNKSQSQALRTYINSLWKWKMSNVEASYYAKFIKVFKQSQQLITLSKILNKKYSQHLHSAFRMVIVEGYNRQYRKQRIVEKYLMRKLNNYFQRFKTNACFQQIKTWRNMYTLTIKGKKLIDLIQKFARRTLTNSLKAIMRVQYSNRVLQRFSQKISNFKLLMLRDAFYKLNRRVLETSFDSLEKKINKIILRYKQQSLDLMKTTTKVFAIQTSINKIIPKLMKKYGFYKIQYKANLIVKCRLAINLLSYMNCMEEQKLKQRINISIRALRNNSHKIQAVRNVTNLLTAKQRSNLSLFYRILKQSLDKRILLGRFKKGMVIKKILEKQNNKALKRIFEMMKKKQNKWLVSSIKSFILRSSLKSSTAVSLWRMKSFAQKATN